MFVGTRYKEVKALKEGEDKLQKLKLTKESIESTSSTNFDIFFERHCQPHALATDLETKTAFLQKSIQLVIQPWNSKIKV